ncbi:MAG TPA: toll/interleukin-1 receptor domain-containing protein [Saprospiraceae bacterium]|nr:toll/interleukin-1 receptor domain-containing protein [Saprospiraceae bacterium]
MNTQKTIYISHAWGGTSDEILSQLVPRLEAENIAFILDKRDLGYRQSIRDFMVRLGKADMVIIILSNKYLKSEYCMFELIQIYHNQNLVERIFPIVLDEVKISSSSDRLDFVKYWEGQLMDLQNKVKELNSLSYIEGITDDLNLYSEIRNNIARLTGILRDLNTLNVTLHQESDYHYLIAAIKNKINEKQSSETIASPEEKPISAISAEQTTAESKKINRGLKTPMLVRNLIIAGLALFGLFMLWGILTKSDSLANNNGNESDHAQVVDTSAKHDALIANQYSRDSLTSSNVPSANDTKTHSQPSSTSSKKTTITQGSAIVEKQKNDVTPILTQPEEKKENIALNSGEIKSTPSNVNPPPADPPKEVVLNKSTVIAKGTTITGRSNLAITSDDPNPIPRRITFLLDKPLYHGSQIVVPSGSLITASVVKVRTSEYRRKGSMDLVFEQLQAPGNQTIPLAGNEMHLEAKGVTPYEIKVNTTFLLKIPVNTTIRY